METMSGEMGGGGREGKGGIERGRRIQKHGFESPRECMACRGENGCSMKWNIDTLSAERKKSCKCRNDGSVEMFPTGPDLAINRGLGQWTCTIGVLSKNKFSIILKPS